jgi:hypothetical protein
MSGGSGATLSTVVLLLVGTGGIGAAITAIIKLPRERNSAAVTEAQGNAAAATNLLREVTADRDYWKGRCMEAEKELDEHRKLDARGQAHRRGREAT